MEPSDAQPQPVIRRHPLLSVFLWWLVAANAIAAILAPFLLVSIRRQSTPDFPEWAGWPFALLSALGAACAVALLSTKKWGFYGYALTAAGIFALNVYAGVGPVASAVGLIGTAILFAVLHIGGENKAWSRLR
jgi:hypothetical protein